jgi:hypothetical protein
LSSIKKIYTFGTSFTEGGGFEFDKPEPKYCNHGLYKHYGHLDEEKTRANFSWPGQLQKLYNSVKIINKAKSGYGNERIYRRAFDIITDTSFNKDESLLLFEFSDVGRKELFNSEIDDYIILNYWWDEYPAKDSPKVSSFAKEYYYDSDDITNIIKKDSEFLSTYIQKTIKFEEVIKTLTRNIHLFLSFLNENNINYRIISTEFVNFNLNIKTNLDFLNSKRVLFELPNGEIFNDVMELFGQHELSIESETNKDISDGGHLGYYGNRLVARLIGNFLEKNNIINIENKKELNVDYNQLIKK